MTKNRWNKKFQSKKYQLFTNATRFHKKKFVEDPPGPGAYSPEKVNLKMKMKIERSNDRVDITENYTGNF